MWRTDKTPPIGGILAFTLLALPLVLASTTAQARIETLRWEHPDPSSVAFFRIYLRDASGDYGEAVYQGLPTADGNTFSYSLVVADRESVYVAVSAVGETLLESEPSNEQLRAPAPGSQPGPDSGEGSGIGRGDSGGGGGGAVNVVTPQPGELLAELSGEEKLRVRAIGGQRDSVRMALAFGDGLWMALDAEGRIISGTYRSAGRTGRKAVLRLDDDSLEVVLALVESWAPQLGLSDFQVELRRAPEIVLKLNRERTRVRLTGKFKFDETDGEARLGKYFFDARGPLVETHESLVLSR
jgi:hypothetical protein